MKRVLKPKIEKALIGFEFALIAFVAMIDSFEPSFTPYMIAVLFVIVLVLMILNKYGKEFNK